MSDFFLNLPRCPDTMSKRARSDTLTGGTGDVNPQTLGGTVTQTSAETFTQTTIPVPVNRVTSSSSFAQVIEILWLEISLVLA